MRLAVIIRAVFGVSTPFFCVDTEVLEDWFAFRCGLIVTGESSFIGAKIAIDESTGRPNRFWRFGIFCIVDLSFCTSSVSAAKRRTGLPVMPRCLGERPGVTQEAGICDG